MDSEKNREGTKFALSGEGLSNRDKRFRIIFLSDKDYKIISGHARFNYDILLKHGVENCFFEGCGIIFVRQRDKSFLSDKANTKKPLNVSTL